jgi:hypothetical protein
MGQILHFDIDHGFTGLWVMSWLSDPKLFPELCCAQHKLSKKFIDRS